MATQPKPVKVINGINVGDLLTTIDSIKTAPHRSKFKFRIHNEWVTGGFNRSLVSNFQGNGETIGHKEVMVLEADEPEVLLGADKAVNPVEHLLHSLAACVTSTMVYHAAARGIQVEEVESYIEGDIDIRGFLGLDENVPKGYQAIRMNFKIRADVPDRQLQEICQLGYRYSPVFNSITRGVPVSVTAERG